ncbi:unnamed protein product, partial [Timema podura]|nr:unnamed protein product [Timema podura]
MSVRSSSAVAIVSSRGCSNETDRCCQDRAMTSNIIMFSNLIESRVCSPTCCSNLPSWWIITSLTAPDGSNTTSSEGSMQGQGSMKTVSEDELSKAIFFELYAQFLAHSIWEQRDLVFSSPEDGTYRNIIVKYDDPDIERVRSCEMHLWLTRVASQWKEEVWREQLANQHIRFSVCVRHYGEEKCQMQHTSQ